MQLSLVVPSYNEEIVLPEMAARLSTLLAQLVRVGTVVEASRIYFIDDGSTDKTWAIIESLAKSNPAIKESGSPAIAGIRSPCLLVC